MGKAKTIWFKRRRYGWGWVPVTWQGWLVVVLFIAIVVSGVFTQATGAHLLAVILAAVALTCISAAKGPKPRWRWGKKSDDNPDDDW